MTNPTQPEPPADLREAQRHARRLRANINQMLEEHRAPLFAYCRRLTGQLWDAEDLFQEVMLKACAKLSEVSVKIEHPRAWLFRIATNLWIDWQRKSGRVDLTPLPEEGLAMERHQEPVETAGFGDEADRMLALLPPRELVAVLLCGVFGFSRGEAASQLRTTEVAIKGLLSRARARLAERPAGEPTASTTSSLPKSDPALVAAFVEHFNRRDVPGLVSLLLPGATAHIPGMVEEYDRDQIARGTLGHTVDGSGILPTAEVRELLGRTVVLLWYPSGVNPHEDIAAGTATIGETKVSHPEVIPGTPGSVVKDIILLGTAGGGIASVTYYYFSPEFLHAAGELLCVPVEDNGWTL